MYSVPTLFAGAPSNLSYDPNRGDEDDHLSTYVWLFTDPSAIDVYARIGKLDQLEQDICTYVMFHGRWSPDELDFKREIDRLFYSEVLAPQSAYGNLSPHPTIYQAAQDGKIEVNGEKIHFNSGDHLVFEPWPARLSQPGLVGPLRVGWLDTSTHLVLCRDAFPQLDGISSRELEMLHQISCYPKHRGF